MKPEIDLTLINSVVDGKSSNQIAMVQNPVNFIWAKLLNCKLLIRSSSDIGRGRDSGFKSQGVLDSVD